jgi:hypothetical protein
MIPAVEDFTQKAWAQQQAALLQQQAPAAAEEPIPTDSEYEGAAAAAAAAGDGQLELLGKLLVTPEQLRQKISVSLAACNPLLHTLADASFSTLQQQQCDDSCGCSMSRPEACASVSMVHQPRHVRNYHQQHAHVHMNRL